MRRSSRRTGQAAAAAKSSRAAAAADDDSQPRRRKQRKELDEREEERGAESGDYVGWSRLYGLAAGLALVGVRLLGAAVNPVADCDETYNYWEPVHYLAFGSGMQTWEYSPRYTLRSYAYLLPHAALAKVMALALALVQRHPIDKTLIFYGVRATLGLLSAACEATFVDAVTRRFGARPGVLTFLLLLTSAGVFQASTAMLPSSAAACLVMLAHASWMTRRHWQATFWAVAAVLGLGWPFVALLFLPLAMHVLADAIHSNNKAFFTGTFRVVHMGLTSVALILPPVLLVDYWFYRRFAFPALNIFLYNIGGGAEGADDTLYGVEPWSFYLKNLLLNFNVALPLALLLPLALPLSPRAARVREALLFTGPAFLWLAVMTARPHKEERFLFPIYPLLALAAALTVQGLTAALQGMANATAAAAQRHPPRSSPLLTAAGTMCGAVARLFAPLVILAHLLLGASRAASMALNFAAPVELFSSFARGQRSLSLQHLQQENKEAPLPQLLCMGGEWYRFPSSFFLPHHNMHLAFVRSHFKAQLPQPFRPENGTWAPPLQPFNQHNREEPSRYVPVHACRYLVELIPPPPQGKEGQGEEEAAMLWEQRWVEERLRELGEERPAAWTVRRRSLLLDKDASPFPYRAFWLPFLSRRKVRYGAFTLLERGQEDVCEGEVC